MTMQFLELNVDFNVDLCNPSVPGKICLFAMQASFDISKLWGQFYKFETPEVQIKLHFG